MFFWGMLWGAEGFFNVIRRFILIMAILLVSGCLEFGDDIYLTAPDVNAKELDEVTRHTGIAPGNSRAWLCFYGFGY